MKNLIDIFHARVVMNGLLPQATELLAQSYRSTICNKVALQLDTKMRAKRMIMKRKNEMTLLKMFLLKKLIDIFHARIMNYDSLMNDHCHMQWNFFTDEIDPRSILDGGTFKTN